MQSLKELYRIGRGPSSSHTMGPERAVKLMRDRYPQADELRAVLYGSLACTGAGHGTAEVIASAAKPLACAVSFDLETPCPVHPNTLKIDMLENGALLCSKLIYSVGGGAVKIDGESDREPADVYPHSTLKDITEYCNAHNMRLWQYALECEGDELFDYLRDVWETMKRSIDDGLSVTGVLPGKLGVKRRAQELFNKRHIDESAQTRENRIVCAYAFAASEQNAAGGVIATAPTCGACGVVPSVLKYMQESRAFSDEKILRALAAGGIIGDLIKTNASISGAECGCQAEIGSACSMAAAALAELFDMGLGQIDYAAEVAMEHHLGLTCDPIGGLVQIPCIERNAVAAMRAINALSLANFLADSRKISFDIVVKTMYNTGKDLLNSYRETSFGGLAKYYEID